MKPSTDQAAERERLSLALNDIDAHLHSSLDIDEIMQAALDDFVETLHTDAGDIKVRDANGWVVRFQNGFGVHDAGLRLTESDAPIAVRVYASRGPVVVSDYSSEPTLRTGFPLTHKLTATLAVPLVIRDEVIGALFAQMKSGPREFTEAEVDFARRMAASASLALENARLLQAERLRASRMEVLRDVAELVTSSLEPEHVIAEVLQSTTDHIGVRAASVWLTDESSGRLRMMGAVGFPDQAFTDTAEGLPIDAEADVAVAVRTGEPVIHENVESSDVSAHALAIYRRYGVALGALIVLPLRVGADVIGALTLAWEEPRRFDSDSLAFDLSLANTFSTAIANARLYQEVRASGERVAEIIDSMNDGFVSVDREWRYTLVNKRAEKMLNRSAEDLLGKRMDEEFPDIAGWPYYRKAMDERVPVKFESYAQVAHAWVEVHAYPTLDGISMYVSDITERKTTEEGLARANRLLDAHIGNSPLGVVEFDSAFNIVRWSDGAERMFGWTAEEALGQTMTGLPWIYEEDTGIVEQESTGLFKGETPRSFNTNRNYRKDGAVIWCEWYSSAIHDDKGDLVSIFSQVLDITSRREAEEALRSALAEVAAERTRLRQIIDEIPIGVAVAGPDGAILEINEETNRIWAGVLPMAGNVEEYAVYEGFHHDTNEPVQADEWPGVRALESRRPELGLFDVVRLDRTSGTIRVSALPIIDDANELTRVVVITEDVTEQVDAQRLAALLNESSMAVSSTLDEDEIVERLSAAGHEAFRTHAAAAVVRRGEHWVVQSGIGIPDELLGKALRASDELEIRAALNETEPVFSSDAEKDSRVRASKLAELGAKSVIALPLISQGKNSGALIFWYTGRRRDFSEPQLEFARKLMMIATLALDNAHLYQREHHIAETLQEAILTPPEPIDGLDISYVYEPASAAANVGGDFYDVVEVEPHRIGVIVGDVSGKGIDAARFTTLMKDGARAFLLQGDDPGTVLEKLNFVAWRSTPLDRFATAFLGIFDSAEGVFRYSGAGHPSSFLLGPEGVTALESSAGVLGAWEGLHLETRQTRLEPGEVLVMYTDGVTEARRGRELYGEARLVDALWSLRATAVADLPQAILDAVLEFSDGKLRDDVVILCLARKA